MESPRFVQRRDGAVRAARRIHDACYVPQRPFRRQGLSVEFAGKVALVQGASSGKGFSALGAG
jgi:hypothetical protein